MNNDVSRFKDEMDNVNDYSRYIFNSVIEDVNSTLKSLGKKVDDRLIMNLYDAYCSGYYYLLQLHIKRRFGEDNEARKLLTNILSDLLSLITYISVELATGSNLGDYYELSEKWQKSDDVMKNPLMNTIDQIQGEQNNLESIKVIMNNYSKRFSEIEKAFKSKD